MKLKDRDPRNRKHVQAALEIIQKHRPRITSECARLINALGVPASSKMIISDKPRDKERAVCTFFFLEDGLMFANNVLGTCCICRIPLQMRPSSSVLTEQICVFCAAEDCLEYQKKTAAKRGGRSHRGGRPS